MEKPPDSLFEALCRVLARWSGGSVAKSPGTPLSPAEWREPPAVSPSVRTSRNLVQWALLVAAVVAGASIATWFGQLGQVVGAFFGLIICLALLARSKKYHTCPPALRGLADLPSDDRQFPVEVRYGIDGLTYGVDRGLLCFSGPWMHFEGLESEFSVSSEDARRLHPANASAAVDVFGAAACFVCARDADPLILLADELRNAWPPVQVRRRVFSTFQVAWRASDHKGGIEIRPYSSFTAENTGDWSKPRTAFAAWLQSGEAPEGPSVLPPIRTQPSYLRLALHRRALVGATCLVILVCAVWPLAGVVNEYHVGLAGPLVVFQCLLLVGLVASAAVAWFLCVDDLVSKLQELR